MVKPSSLPAVALVLQGCLLRALRAQARLKQSDTAQAGFKQVAVSRWEAGSHDPTLSQVAELVKLYGVSLERFTAMRREALDAIDARPDAEDIAWLAERGTPASLHALRGLCVYQVAVTLGLGV